MKILIINQHAENRGDESALIGMIHGINEQLQTNCKYTILGQFKDKDYTIQLPKPIKYKFINIVFSSSGYLKFFLFTFIKRVFKVEINQLLNKNTNEIINSYKQADIVISAPGAGYIGDIYKSHEFIHWLYIYLGSIFKKKMMLYAPSLGPFNDTFSNYFRKKILKLFNEITVRESKSIDYLQRLDPTINATLSADASLQFKVKKNKSIFKANENKFIVAIVASDYKYRERYHEKKAIYINAIIKLITHMSQVKNTHFIFMPQLVGRVHDDYLFQKMIGKMLPVEISWEILDRKYDSIHQKQIFASSDFAISSRYHPGIFATSAHIPGIFLAYEHKQIGYFKDLKYPFVYDINNIKTNNIINDVHHILKNYDKIKNELKENIKPLIHRAKIPSKIAKKLILIN